MRFLLPRDLEEAIVGDLTEAFEQNLKRYPRTARWIFLWRAIEAVMETRFGQIMNALERIKKLLG